MLRANLEALARRDPELVTRIGWPVDNRHVTSDAGGALLYQVQQTRHRLSLTPDAVAAHFAEISDMSKAQALESAAQQTQKYIGQAVARAGIKL